MKFKIFLFSFFLPPISFSQAPEIEWQNTIGGTSDDDLQSVVPTFDGGYILGGSSYSQDGFDKTEERIGDDDYWVVKINHLGIVEWDETIGGTGRDNVYAIQQTPDGGYIVGGESVSNISADKSENRIGGADYWIVKIDGEGNIEWENTIGAAGEEYFTALDQTADGGYIIGGYSHSNANGDKTEDLIGDHDYWIVKLDGEGNVEWDETIGGLWDDYLTAIQQTMDGGYIIGGYSDSDMSGDKSENTIGPDHLNDYWIVKIDNTGNIEWENTIGGTKDDALYAIQQTPDGGYIVGGGSYSNESADKSEHRLGETDYWVIKLYENGTIEWENTIGGDDDDYLYTLDQIPGDGYLLGGKSLSNISDDKTENMVGAPWYTGYDYWVVKLNNEGIVEWDNTIGGNDSDDCTSVKSTSDGGFVLAGYSESPVSGDKIEDIGEDDYWVVKLFPDSCFVITEICNGLDDDCNGIIDDGFIYLTYYEDADDDGFGNISITTTTCIGLPPPGFVADSSDCDDNNDLIYPSATEVCNGFDENCNILIDEGLTLYNYFADIDEDGFGNADEMISICNVLPPVGYITDSTDCDDTNDLIHEPILYYADIDGDLFGDELNSEYFCDIFIPDGYVTNNTDCDDLNILINPVTNEICNNIDDNCNTEIDEGLPMQTLYIDADGDNFGNYLIDTITCLLSITGYLSDSTDCDDTNPDIYPGATEILNGIDDDCDKLIDEGITAIIDQTNKFNISIYPNPNDGTFTITANVKTQYFASPELPTIEIYNNLGQLIYFKKINTSSGTINETIQLQNPSPGVYFVNLKNQHSILNNKLIIE
ncbi:MAG: T9SS type A sorting domain-containing protein [Bacteroidetes bacterium]|jgi:hypothetical protein|nr:T9SS type A sorting domain-containing protein [Bacteroidota bacterium]MBK7569128.1 T9SS type A sorting domain-containing protein [Bacteroidota bacterium]MBP9794498.1 T9SS type A sorting domain-containing protein [Chitinophagales bacterium]